MGNDRFPVHFTNTQRSFAVHEILQTTPFGRTQKGEIGIDRLIRDGVFQAAYPLHEGDYKYDPTEIQTPRMENNPRRILYDTWARYRVFYKAQPLDLIREYFGEKISLYFAWLGENRFESTDLQRNFLQVCTPPGCYPRRSSACWSFSSALSIFPTTFQHKTCAPSERTSPCVRSVTWCESAVFSRSSMLTVSSSVRIGISRTSVRTRV